MTKTEIRDLVCQLPQIRALSIAVAGGPPAIPADQVKAAALAYVDAAVDEIANSYDWPFAVDDATETTVEDQAEYEITGNNNDCRSVINITYWGASDTSGLLLQKFRASDVDVLMSQRSASDTFGWYFSGLTSNGIVKVTLIGAPDASGDSLKYRYRKSNVKLETIPVNYHATAVVSGTAKRLIPGYDAVFKEDLANMRAFYEGGGGEFNPIRRDPVLIQRNNERNALHGYS